MRGFNYNVNKKEWMKGRKKPSKMKINFKGQENQYSELSIK